MELSDRKKKILQYVVDDYIETAVPVSSKSLTEKYMKNVSSATVRARRVRVLDAVAHFVGARAFGGGVQTLRKRPYGQG